MSFPDAFSRQIQAFHTAIIDDCDRAARPEQNDAMVLRLRANALALAKVQLAMMTLVRAEPPELVAAAVRHPDDVSVGDRLAASDDTTPSWPGERALYQGIVPTIHPPNDEAPMPLAHVLARATMTLGDDHEDRVLTGDALSRFVSRRLEPGESPHEVWQRLQEPGPAKRRGSPALPRAGFRSSSG
jgi:hypothetical protein